MTARLKSAQAAAARHKEARKEAQAQLAQLERAKQQAAAALESERHENEQLSERMRCLEQDVTLYLQQRDDALVGAG